MWRTGLREQLQNTPLYATYGDARSGWCPAVRLSRSENPRGAVIERRSLQLVSWSLDDGERLHREAPSTFWMPSAERRHALVEGDLVKLIFSMSVRDPATGRESLEVERMWVIVKGRDANRYRGVLDNDPYCTRDLVNGAVVEFEPRHVIQIYDDA